MNHFCKGVAYALGLFLLGGCEPKPNWDKACKQAQREALSLEEVPLRDLSPALFLATEPAAMSSFLEAHPALRLHFFDSKQYSDSDYLSHVLAQLVQNPHIDSLHQDVQTHYGDLSVLRKALSMAWGRLQAYDTAFVAPEVQILVSGLYKDLYLSDSLIIVGLDYFIGPSARYPPQGLPLYLLRRHTPRHLVPILLFYFSERYNKTALSDNTLLSEMIAMGKTYAFTKYMLPCTPDSLIVGYTPQEMQAVEDHQEIIWDYFLHNQLLYETKRQIKDTFIGERPKILAIGHACPGRIGYWLGWQLTKAYLQQQPEKGLSGLRKLMNEKNAQKIFSLAKYRPKK